CVTAPPVISVPRYLSTKLASTSRVWKAMVLFFYASPRFLQPPPPHLLLDTLPASRFAGLRRHPLLPRPGRSANDFSETRERVIPVLGLAAEPLRLDDHPSVFRNAAVRGFQQAALD